MAFEIKSLTKSYSKENVFTDQNFFFSSAGLIGIIGTSGTGKSTLLKCINGTEKYEKGRMIFDGERIINMDSFAKEHVTYIDQQYHMIHHLTVEDHIRFFVLMNGVDIDEKEYEEYMELLHIREVLHHYPDELSTGQRDRITLLEALIVHKDILLLDEILASVNDEYKNIMMKLIKRYSQKHLVLLTGHDEKILKEYCDAMIDLDEHALNYFACHNLYTYTKSGKYTKKKWKGEYLLSFFRKHKAFLFSFMIVNVFSLTFILILLSAFNSYYEYYEKEYHALPEVNSSIVTKNDYMNAKFNQEELEKMDYSWYYDLSQGSFDAFDCSCYQLNSLDLGDQNMIAISSKLQEKTKLKEGDSLIYTLNNKTYVFKIGKVIQNTLLKEAYFYDDASLSDDIKEQLYDETKILISTKIKNIDYSYTYIYDEYKDIGTLLYYAGRIIYIVIGIVFFMMLRVISSFLSHLYVLQSKDLECLSNLKLNSYDILIKENRILHLCLSVLSVILCLFLIFIYNHLYDITLKPCLDWLIIIVFLYVINFITMKWRCLYARN